MTKLNAHTHFETPTDYQNGDRVWWYHAARVAVIDDDLRMVLADYSHIEGAREYIVPAVVLRMNGDRVLIHAHLMGGGYRAVNVPRYRLQPDPRPGHESWP